MTLTDGAPVTKDQASLADQIAAAHADDVDATSRFPSEAIAALRAGRLLGALVPVELGGGGRSIADVAEITAALSRQCSSTGMIFAMHQIQVASLLRHGRSAALRAFLSEVAAEQLLLASATTERGIGGDVRSSTCFVDMDGANETFVLEKDAPVISYGRFADAILVTARRTRLSPPGDQVLVVCRSAETTLEQTSIWSAMGMRGTCSDGFRLRATSARGFILDDAYAEISSHTMLPVSHLLWASVWSGITTAAVDRARRFVQQQARSTPGVTPPSATRLAELVAGQLQLAVLTNSAVDRFTKAMDDPEALESLGFTIEMNAVKTTASTAVFDLVHKALLVVGILGFREDTPFSMSRLLRDAAGGAVMVANDRVTANNAQMLLGHKGR